MKHLHIITAITLLFATIGAVQAQEIPTPASVTSDDFRGRVDIISTTVGRNPLEEME